MNITVSRFVVSSFLVPIFIHKELFFLLWISDCFLLFFSFSGKNIPQWWCYTYWWITSGNNTYNQRNCKLAYGIYTEYCQYKYHDKGSYRSINGTRQCLCNTLVNNFCKACSWRSLRFILTNTVKYYDGIVDGVSDNRKHTCNKGTSDRNKCACHYINSQHSNYIMNKCQNSTDTGWKFTEIGRASCRERV